MYVFSKFESIFSVFIADPARDEYMAWLSENRSLLGAPDHRTSPIVWFEDSNKYLGGRDDTLAWCRNYFRASDDERTNGESRHDELKSC